MAAGINIPVYSDALVALGTAGVIVPLAKRYGMSPVLGYLIAGIILGPLGLGRFIEHMPLLTWFTVVDANNIAGIADLGVVFLLFLIGLELSFSRLLLMRKWIIGLGGTQIALSTVLLMMILYMLGITGDVALIIAGCLSLSSTAIVLELFSQNGRMNTAAGRASFAVLLAQDLAVIPLLMFVSVLGSAAHGSLWALLGQAGLQALLAVAVIVGVGRLCLRPLFRLVANANSSELFIATLLFVIVGTSVVASMFGLSMALGAFVAGLLLAETEYRKLIQATIDPFKGLLLGLFFFTVGMKIDLQYMWGHAGVLAGLTLLLLASKAVVLFLISQFSRLEKPAALEMAVLLSAGGEFAFVVITLAQAQGSLPAPIANMALSVSALSMLLLLPLAAFMNWLLPRFSAPQPLPEALLAVPASQEKHAIVIGYGRVGKMVGELLAEHQIAFTATDNHADAVTDARNRHEPVYFGDATSPAFLDACGIKQAAGVIVTTQSYKTTEEIVSVVRQMNPNVMIIARARDTEHARKLYALGVNDVVPETTEASLQLAEAALVGLGVPTGFVIASIHEQRDVIRQKLQSIAHKAGQPHTRSLRAKRSALSSQATKNEP